MLTFEAFAARNEISARAVMKAQRLRALAVKAYWAAKTPTEAKMAGILCDLFAPELGAFKTAPPAYDKAAVYEHWAAH